jgi:hypothetical protein
MPPALPGEGPSFEPPIARLAAEHLEPALGVFEAAQALFALDDVAEMLAVLARSLCELIDAKACMVSMIDTTAGIVRDGRRIRGTVRPKSRGSRTIRQRPT